MCINTLQVKLDTNHPGQKDLQLGCLFVRTNAMQPYEAWFYLSFKWNTLRNHQLYNCIVIQHFRVVQSLIALQYLIMHFVFVWYCIITSSKPPKDLPTITDPSTYFYPQLLHKFGFSISSTDQMAFSATLFYQLSLYSFHVGMKKMTQFTFYNDFGKDFGLIWLPYVSCGQLNLFHSEREKWSKLWHNTWHTIVLYFLDNLSFETTICNILI